MFTSFVFLARVRYFLLNQYFWVSFRIGMCLVRLFLNWPFHGEHPGYIREVLMYLTCLQLRSGIEKFHVWESDRDRTAYVPETLRPPNISRMLPTKRPQLINCSCRSMYVGHTKRSFRLLNFKHIFLKVHSICHDTDFEMLHIASKDALLHRLGELEILLLFKTYLPNWILKMQST